jgi:hypothetical protein
MPVRCSPLNRRKKNDSVAASGYLQVGAANPDAGASQGRLSKLVAVPVFVSSVVRNNPNVTACGWS